MTFEWSTKYLEGKKLTQFIHELDMNLFGDVKEIMVEEMIESEKNVEMKGEFGTEEDWHIWEFVEWPIWRWISQKWSPPLDFLNLTIRRYLI